MTFEELYAKHAYVEPYDDTAFRADVFNYLAASGVPKRYRERVLDAAIDLDTVFGTPAAMLNILRDLVRIWERDFATWPEWKWLGQKGGNPAGPGAV